MRLAILASGSGGNAVVVEADGTSVLLDCGISNRQLERRMAAVGWEVEAIDAVCVSHEHVDHVRGLPVLVRRRRLPVFATAGTIASLPEPLATAEPLTPDLEVRIGAVTVTPLATSHDAAEPVAFVVAAGSRRAAVVTDTGTVTGALHEALIGCHALLLEANHDPDMLRLGTYPWPLKQRIASPLGHLSNQQCRAAVEGLAHGDLKVVVGMHLSRENNVPDLALRELAGPLTGSAVHVAVAHQERPLVVEVPAPAPSGGQGTLF